MGHDTSALSAVVFLHILICTTYPRNNCGPEDPDAEPAAVETRTTTLEMPLSSMSELPIMYRGTLDNSQVAAMHIGATAPDETNQTG